MDAAGGAGAREREHTHLIAATHLPDILFTHNTPSLPYTQTHTYAHTHTHTPADTRNRSNTCVLVFKSTPSTSSGVFDGFPSTQITSKS